MALNVLYAAQAANATPLQALGVWESLSLQDAGAGDFVTLPNGARMHYVTRGPLGRDQPERDLVLIHGLLDSTDAWNKNIDALAINHRVWAIDLIGFGFSSRLTERVYTMKNFARWVWDFMNAAEIQRAALIGHSLGGAIALQFAHDLPQRVDRLVLIAPAAYWWFPAPLRLAARIPALPRAALQWALNNRRAHSAVWYAAVGDTAALDPSEVALRERHLRVHGTLDAFVAMVGSPRESDLPRGLGAIAAPALVLWGEKDRVLPPSHGARLVRDLPNARRIVIPNAGHVVQEQAPDIVNQAILEFLRGS